MKLHRQNDCFAAKQGAAAYFCAIEDAQIRLCFDPHAILIGSAGTVFLPQGIGVEENAMTTTCPTADREALMPAAIRQIVVWLCLLIAAPVMAQDKRTETVKFPPGASGTTISGSIRGYQIVDYRLGANAGQRMAVDMKTSNLSSYFNVMAPGERDVAFFIGSTEGTRYDGRLPASGTYTIRVYMMRNAARRDEVANYKLSVSIDGNRPASPPVAEGGADGPDFYQVSGLTPGDTLNMREGPGTRYRVVLQLAEGTVVRNLGCQGAGRGRWCRVDYGNGTQPGWVSGRYLIEASGTPAQRPGDALVPGTHYHATGPMPCRFSGDANVKSCQFGVVRLGKGDARIDIAFPDGFKRTLFYEGGRWMSPDTGEIVAARFGDETEITVNGSERFTIPDVVIEGD